MLYHDSMRCARVVLLMSVWLQATQAARILVFVPFPMKSHHSIFQPVVRELADRGHQVTYYTPVPMQDPVPNTLRQVILPNTMDVLKSKEAKQIFLEGGGSGPVDFGKVSIPSMSLYFLRNAYELAERTLGLSCVQELVHSNETYDLILHEAIVNTDPIVAFQHKFKALGVSLMTLSESFWVHEMSGLTNNPAYMVDFRSDLSDRMSFPRRLLSFYHLTSSLLLYYCYQQYYYQEIMDKYFNYTGWEDRPSIFHLLSDQALILVNSHHSFGYNYPRAPHVKEVGGLNILPPRPLPKELKKIMDDAQEGVIYFSLGSNINVVEDLSKEAIDAFINVFSKLKKTVLWKWSGEKYPTVPNNIYMQNWYPQQDLMAHKNTKLFIMHGGQSSSLEAVTNALPVIAIPFFADQRRNVERITSAGFGLLLEQDNLTESSIAWAIDEVLNNQKYKQQSILKQRIFQDRPMKPVEEAVYWIEYVLKHGNILQPASVHMPLYQLLLLDVLGAITAGILLIVLISKSIIRKTITQLGNGNVEKIKQK